MKRDPERRFTRRSLLAGAAVLGGGLLGFRFRSRAATLRPPGAAPDFAEKCIRCLRCATVCPTKAIRFDSSLDPFGSETPYIDAVRRGCSLCMKCTEVCPSGALTPIENDPDTVRASVRMGTAEVDRSTCIAWTGTGECRACYYVCPYAGDAVRLAGMLLVPVVDPRVCVGCGLCAEACPERVRSIAIRPAEGQV